MSDKELADRELLIKALSLLGNEWGYNSMQSYIWTPTQGHYDIDTFPPEMWWAVAGALMEKCLDGKPNTMWLDWYEQPPIFQVLLSRSVIAESESLPRAITEACVEALSDE